MATSLLQEICKSGCEEKTLYVTSGVRNSVETVTD
jgi:hypothetical protein